jgi:putative NIF3 family GTP cyclohydrolase 1 type 2
VQGGCALLAVHTNGDVAHDGVSDALAAALGVGATSPVVPDPGAEGTGLGRIGELEAPSTLLALAEHVRASLPATAHGVRVAGDPERVVRRVAVVGGSGSDAIEAAAQAGADVVVTADLKHHTAGDVVAADGPALLDVAHWASEWPWLGLLRERLVSDLAARGVTVVTHVSTIVTDPWTARL